METARGENVKLPWHFVFGQCDLAEREVEEGEIEKFATDHEFIGWSEISAKNGTMIDESVRSVLRAKVRHASIKW